MKNIFYFLLSALLIIPAACTDDFDEINTDPKNLTAAALGQGEFGLIFATALYTPVHVGSEDRGSFQLAHSLFADIYANYNAPDLGMAAVEGLETRGCRVLMPPQKGCGYPFIGYGDLTQARKVAEENVRSLAFYTEQGYDIVATEPTAVYCLKVSYPKLLNDRQDSIDVANRTYEYFEYLEMLEARKT